ncbi:unnamed protein product [Anisakis simplex]|uniref:SET domain-containing protein n=1 Tax=Anisakis simplex TaxID=6269 RepID=A0A158PN30_ANISI|nr:unnamed protein product [Anisakis simplex]
MESVSLQRVCFDIEDRPPPSYWNNTKETVHSSSRTRTNSSQSSGAGTPISTSYPKISKIDPQEWLKAPEFIPRSKQLLNESFRTDMTTPTTNYMQNQGPLMPTLAMNGFTNIPEAPLPAPPRAAPPLPPFSSLPTIIDMPQPVYPSHGTIGFPLTAQATRYPPLPRSLGIVRFPIPRITTTTPTPFLLRPPLGLVPPGYSANITQINAGMGPPIPALVLKKKRRKRHRRLKELSTNQTEKDASNVAHPVDPNGYVSEGDDNSTKDSTQFRLQLASSEPDLTKNSNSKRASEESGNIEGSLLHGSCPDLSDSQLQLWDSLLYDAVVNEQQRLDNETSSILPRDRSKSRSECPMPMEYEIASRAVLSAIDSALHADGICSKEVRRLDKQLQGRDNVDNRFVDSPASTTKSLKAEIEELSFRPTISHYGYPQSNPVRAHMATFNPDYNTTESSIVDRGEEQGYVEDCFEGMHIRVNRFDEGDGGQTDRSCHEYRLFFSDTLYYTSSADITAAENFFPSMMNSEANNRNNSMCKNLLYENFFQELALSDSELPRPSRFQQIQWALQRGKEQYTRLVPPQRVCCSLM